MQDDDLARMQREMYAEMRDLLGSGYVPVYYEDAASGFVEIARAYVDRATPTAPPAPRPEGE